MHICTYNVIGEIIDALKIEHLNWQKMGGLLVDPLSENYLQMK